MLKADNTICPVCGNDKMNGAVACTAVDGKFICGEHCGQCKYRIKGSCSTCMWRSPKFKKCEFLLPYKVAEYLEVHKNRTTAQLQASFSALDKLFDEHPEDRFRIGNEYEAIRKLLFKRQFTDSYKTAVGEGYEGTGAEE